MCQNIVLEQDLKSLPCTIKVFTVPFFVNERKGLFFCFWPPRSLLSESRVGGHGRWSRQMLTLKPCGISDMSPGYVNTCNYFIQQVLLFNSELVAVLLEYGFGYWYLNLFWFINDKLRLLCMYFLCWVHICVDGQL